jgi:hypothetical protein
LETLGSRPILPKLVLTLTQTLTRFIDACGLIVGTSNFTKEIGHWFRLRIGSSGCQLQFTTIVKS